MDISSLTFQQMLRPGSDLKGCTVAERCSIDFLINQRSLLDTLVTAGSDYADYMSCFVKGFCEANSRSSARLLLREPAGTESGRVLLYACPECGDISCGGYSVHVSQTDNRFTWHAFAYENGYEEPVIIDGVGPYTFEKQAYEATLNKAEWLMKE